MTEPGLSPVDRELGGIAEYRPSVALFPDREVLEPPTVFDAWTTFVSHRSVRAIVVAPASRIAWIVTWGGVIAWNRRDEYIYRRYSSEHGLAGTPTCIAVADDDWPWVGQAEGGLSFFDGARWRPYEYLRNERIVAVTAATAGRIWAATPDAILLVTHGSAPVEVVRGNAETTDAAALLDDNGGVLIATPSGLFRASTVTGVERVGSESVGECTALARTVDGGVAVGTLAGVVLPDGSRAESDDGDAAVVSLVSTRGGLWVLTRTGLARIEQGKWRTLRDVPANMPAPRAIAVPVSGDEYLWIGTDDLLSGARASGGGQWDTALLPNHPEDALNNVGRCVVEDDAGRPCIGTAGGLFIGQPDGKWSFDAELGDVRAAISVFGGGTRSVWILSWPRGVLRRARNTSEWEQVTLPPGFAHALVRSHAGDPYVLVGSTLWRLENNDAWRVASGVPPDARLIIHAPQRVWFAGSDRGLFRYTDPGWSLEQDLASVPISALGTLFFQLWVGTRGAVWTLSDRGWRSFALNYEGKPWTEAVTAFASSRSYETPWLACGGRVARFSIETGEILEVYDRFNSGVCGDRVTGLAEIDGVLWVVSRAGIARCVLPPRNG